MVLEQSIAGVAVAVTALAPAAPARAHGFDTVKVERSPAVYASPGGKPVDKVRPKTPYGTKTRLWVRARKPGWLKVASLDAPGNVGWIRSALTNPGPTLWRRVVVDRSQRTLTVLSAAGKRWTVRIGVGAPASPTPTGTYQITDRVRGSRFGGIYGAWVLVLSTYGPHTKAARMALHGVPPAGANPAGSAGCVHVPAAALERLAHETPPGTPVEIRA